MNRALRAATIGALLFTPVALSACSAGQLNQTSSQERDKTGASVTVGRLTLREVQLAYPDSGKYASGDDAELTMAIANGGDSADRLVSVSGTGFTGFRISGTGSAATSSGASAGATTTGATTSAATTGATTSAATSGATTTTGASGGASASPSASASGAAGGQATASGQATATGSDIAGATGSPSSSGSSSGSSGGSQTVQVPAQSVVLLGQNAPHVFLEGLTSSLTAGQSIPLTLTFADAGSVTVRVVVAGPSEQVPVTSSFNFSQAPEPATTSSAGQG